MPAAPRLPVSHWAGSSQKRSGLRHIPAPPAPIAWGGRIRKLAPGPSELARPWEAEELQHPGVTLLPAQQAPSWPDSVPLQPHLFCPSCSLSLAWPLLPKRAPDPPTPGLESLGSPLASGLIPSSPPSLLLSLILTKNPSLAPHAEMELSTRI